MAQINGLYGLKRGLMAQINGLIGEKKNFASRPPLNIFFLEFQPSRLKKLGFGESIKKLVLEGCPQWNPRQGSTLRRSKTNLFK